MAKKKLLKREKLLRKSKLIFKKTRRNIPSKKILHFVDKRPFISFFVALGLLLALIFIGNFVSNLSQDGKNETVFVKDVHVYRIGSSPRIILQGQVEKSGVFKILAQTSGIVSSISVKEGDSVKKGQRIISLSSNYLGGNIPALQASIAHKQYKNILDTYETQKSIIDDQRKVADFTNENTDKLREISRDNLDDTNSLINLNEDMLGTLESQLDVLVATNIGSVNDADIFQTKQLIAQLKSGLVQLKASSRGLSLQTDTDNPPAQLSELSKSITLRQLDLQEKSLDLNKEISRIQSAIAGVSASFMNPAVPYNGVVDRIYVKKGDSVNPGTLLALISGGKQSGLVIVRLPYDMASRVSQTEYSTLFIEGKTYKILPSYVSSQATDGQLYSVIYSITPKEHGNFTDKSYIKVEIPIGYPDTSSVIPFIPLDAVYQTQNDAYVLTISSGEAKSKKITLGTVYGRFVQVLSGLRTNDKVILDRNVIAGDEVNIIN